MHNLYFSKKIHRFLAMLLSVTTLALLAACGDGGTVAGGTTTTAAGGTPTTTATAPKLLIALTDSAGVTVTSVTSSGPTTANATVLDAAGAPVPSAVVTFSTDAALVTLTPSTGSALTNSSGIATVTMNPAGTSTGATTITASSQVGTTAVTGSIGFSVGGLSSGATPLVISTPIFGVGTGALSAFGTTSVTVTVTSGGVPVTTPLPVTFSSPCGASGKAVLTPSVNTVAGVAVASYHDNGCAGTDLITATVSSNISSSATLTITPPDTGSLQFISATPTIISLKGTGGTEVSQVVFKVLDSGGGPLSGKTVTFSLSTSVGGITLNPSPPTAISGSDGTVVALVSSGTISTPVRVTASTPGIGSTILNTQSNDLTVTTGIPDQDSFSLAATKLNMRAWNYDGETTVLTARLSDHFNNPAPDGTPINFTTEGGSIVGSCSTSNGACSSTLTGQNPRPIGGRATVLAYAVGEESFTDLDGDGWADTGLELGSDMGEAYRDDNANGSRDANEPYIDFNANGAFDGPDGKFNGVLCNETVTPGSAAGTCSTVKTIHVRGVLEIVFSGDDPYISAFQGSPLSAVTSVAPINLNCSGGPRDITIYVNDVNNNPMPVGTTIAVTTSDGSLVGTSSFVVPNSTVSPPLPFVVSIKGDGTVDLLTSTCTDPTGFGKLKVLVTVPGIAASYFAEFDVIN